MQAPPEGARGWTNLVPCGRCGQAIDPTKAVYSKQGELICKACDSSDILTEGYIRAAKSSCYGALGTGVLSIFFNPFLIVSIVAVVGSIRALTLIQRPEYRATIGSKYGVFMAAALGGLLTGLVPLGGRVLATAFSIAF